MAGDPFGLAGQVIDGQYRAERIIGEGGFSVVYRGMHAGLGEPIAIKCLKLATQLDSESIESFTRRFRDEGRLQYRLGQGNLDIVRCITSGTVVSTTTSALVPYLVLEWLEGRSLAADLKQRRERGMRGRPIEEVLQMFEPGARALHYAHELGVVHRDVKPGNLFLAHRGGGVRMKVLDFGLAKVLDETIGITLAATLGSVMMCSPRYAAPEQFDPKVGPIGPWTDVYSLAMVVLEALRDQRVRKGDGMVACMTEACDARNTISASSLGIKLPSRVELALARAVAMDVRTRQQSAGQLWDELTGAMQRRNAPMSSASMQAATMLGMPLASEPSTRSPASLGMGAGVESRTLVDVPPTSPMGLGGTVVMQDAPRTLPSPHVQGASGPSTLPLSRGSAMQGYPMSASPPTPAPPSHAIPNLAPALMAPPRPPPLPVAPISYQVPPVSVPIISGRAVQSQPSRAPLVIFMLLLVLGGLGVGAYYAWRAYRSGALRFGACTEPAAGAQSPPCEPS